MYRCHDRKSKNNKFTSKGLNKRALEDCGDGTMSKYPKILEISFNVASTYKRFQTVRYSVATYEQTKRG